MKDMKDNFSRQSDIYASYRPGYPQELFDWIYKHCTAFDTAWDCATGNGQAAAKLAEKFQVVYGTDISINQLENAERKNNIVYQYGAAERTEFAADSFDLITVAQSLHWFDHKLFFKEVKRVAKSGAVFAAWGYNLPRVNPAINDIIDDFYLNITGPFWDEERKHVDNGYADIDIPFEDLPCPGFRMVYGWNAEQMIGYLNSWSAVQHYIEKHNRNPVDLISEILKQNWGDGMYNVDFPIFMRCGRIQK